MKIVLIWFFILLSCIETNLILLSRIGADLMLLSYVETNLILLSQVGTDYHSVSIYRKTKLRI
jgi:hypothetical protein